MRVRMRGAGVRGQFLACMIGVDRGEWLFFISLLACHTHNVVILELLGL